MVEAWRKCRNGVLAEFRPELCVSSSLYNGELSLCNLLLTDVIGNLGLGLSKLWLFRLNYINLFPNVT